MRLESYRTGSNDLTLSSRKIGPAAIGRSMDSILSPDAVDLDAELSYWRHHYRNRADRVLRITDYEPAVKLGLDAYMRGQGRSFAEMEDELRERYRRVRGLSRMDWDEARAVVAAACERLYRQRHAQ